jgi:hypothetical protein
MRRAFIFLYPQPELFDFEFSLETENLLEILRES